MGWVEAVVLGVVQGLTEFLPISSTAHLRVAAALAGWPDPGAAFTAVTQLGTEAAVLLYFRRDITRIAVAWTVSLVRVERRQDPDARMGWYVLAGTAPIAVLGLTLQDTIETGFRDLRLIAVTLIVFGVVLAVADRRARAVRELTELSWPHALLYGAAQSLALVPGVSRSGGTISAGLLLGYRRTAAARYSFLLAVPAVVAAGVLELGRIGAGPTGPAGPGPGAGPGAGAGWPATLIATVVAFAVGYAVIAWLLRFLVRHTFTGFAVYRVGLGLLLLGLLGAGVLPAR